ncbi:MAG: hypothetical protein FJZ43_01015 [Candidatus Staskawiczbacteria bacterium]|nr:hypothetical protein [Candidatus Staskawiczbacteria bacterium]
MHIENETLVGFRDEHGPALGIVCGRIPRTQITLVRHLVSSKGVRKVLLENIEILGKSHEGEDHFSLIERHTGAIAMYFIAQQVA